MRRWAAPQSRSTRGESNAHLAKCQTPYRAAAYEHVTPRALLPVGAFVLKRNRINLSASALESGRARRAPISSWRDAHHGEIEICKTVVPKMPAFRRSSFIMRDAVGRRPNETVTWRSARIARVLIVEKAATVKANRL